MLRSVVVAALLSAANAAWADAIADKAEVCTACHGEKDLPAEPVIPIIWGQNEGYLYLELRDFQKGARKDDRMTPIAQSLSKEDAQSLAAYFAGKLWPKTGAPSASKADEAAAMTAIKSVVCGGCHLDSSRAIPPFRAWLAAKAWDGPSIAKSGSLRSRSTGDGTNGHSTNPLAPREQRLMARTLCAACSAITSPSEPDLRAEGQARGD